MTINRRDPRYVRPFPRPGQLHLVGAPHVGFTCGTFALVVPRPSSPHRIDSRKSGSSLSSLRLWLFLLFFPPLSYPSPPVGSPSELPTQLAFVCFFSLLL